MRTMNYREGVATAALWYDEHHPGWHDRVNLDLLMMWDATNCIAGQILAPGRFETGWHRLTEDKAFAATVPEEVKEACIGWAYDEEAELDFIDERGDPADSGLVHQAWADEIATRRDAAPVE